MKACASLWPHRRSNRAQVEPSHAGLTIERIISRPDSIASTAINTFIMPPIVTEGRCGRSVTTEPAVLAKALLETAALTWRCVRTTTKISKNRRATRRVAHAAFHQRGPRPIRVRARRSTRRKSRCGSARAPAAGASGSSEGDPPSLAPALAHGGQP
jgi:hypothetical protein